MKTPEAHVISTKPVGVSVQGVDLFYGAMHVLKNVSLDIKPGEFFAFLGPSGCGKTTLLRLIAGFSVAQRGQVVIGGAEVSRQPPWQRNVGMVFQSYALWPHMTVRRNVAFGLEERRLPRAEIERRVEAALTLVGLRDLADRKPSQLSGGQQQRVALARTVVIEPKVLLLDEPLSNLDAKLRVQMRRDLLEFQRKLGLTTIFVTHDQEEANTICDRIAVMSDGVVQQVGAPMELYDSPANLFVANFLGTANIVPGDIEAFGSERAFRIAGGGHIPLPRKMEVRKGAKLMFRPQNAAIVPQGGSESRGPVRIAGAITRHEFLGGTIRYGVRIGATEIVADVPHQAGEPLLSSDLPVHVDIAIDKARFLDA